MKAWSFVLFFIGFNFACGLVSALSVLGVFPAGLTGAEPYSETDVASHFALVDVSGENFLITLGLTGITGLIGLIFRQSIFAVYAALVFILGIFTGIGNFVLTGVKSMAETLLAGTGLETIIPIPLQIITTAFFFFFLASILAQRQDLT